MNELQSLSLIFHNKLFRIPDYQRGYAWQDSQLRDFWEDIVTLQPERYHYVGLLSINHLSKEEVAKMEKDAWLINNGFQVYHIVDGQQRLTTFIIMLNEIVELVCRLPDNAGKSEDTIFIGVDSIKDIKAKYLYRKMPPLGAIVSYMFGYENDNPSAKYLEYAILGQPFGGTLLETYYTRNLKYAKEFFAEELQAYYDRFGLGGVEELYRKLTQKMMFNIHEINDEYDVFVAFETMNNRGKKLTNLELLKNRLIYLTTLYDKSVLSDENAKALRDTINDTWTEVYRNLGRNKDVLLSDDEFLRAHWIIFFRYVNRRGNDYFQFLQNYFSQKKIISGEFRYGTRAICEASGDAVDVDEEEFEPLLEEEALEEDSLQPKEILDYINSLKEMAQCWYYTYYPQDCGLLSAEERLWIDRLNRIGIGYFRPMIAVTLLARLGFTPKDRVDLYKAIERFIFIDFRMAMYQSSYKSTVFSTKVHELYAGETGPKAITEELNSITDHDASDTLNAFVVKMNRHFDAGDGFYGWYSLRYFLFEYEYALSVKHKSEKLNWVDFSKVIKDKITIEHILPQTPSKLYWQNQFRQFNEKEIQELSASLGNLLPLGQSKNSKLQNDSFETKVESYRNGCHSEVEVAEKDAWDAQCIYDRGIKLLEFMEDRWGVSFENRQQMEELLHVEFVNDGRVVPEPLTEDVVENHTPLMTKFIMEWAEQMSAEGAIILDSQYCEEMYTRFRTRTVDALIPDAETANSGWKTKNHYFYEIYNRDGKDVRIQLAFSRHNLPENLRVIFDKIPAASSGNWAWTHPFKSKVVEMPWKMTKEELHQVLDQQYQELLAYEDKLVELLKEQ